MSNNRNARVWWKRSIWHLLLHEDRNFICDIIGDIEEKYNVHPEVIHQRLVDGGGSFSVEFSKEIYTNSRIPGEFIEDTLKALDINECDRL